MMQTAPASNLKGPNAISQREPAVGVSVAIVSSRYALVWQRESAAEVLVHGAVSDLSAALRMMPMLSTIARSAHHQARLSKPHCGPRMLDVLEV